MTRNAPAITDDPTFVAVSMSFIDRTGDRRTDTLRCDPAVTDAQVETAAAKYSAASQALLWKVEIKRTWAGVRAPASAAAAGSRDSVYDHIILNLQTGAGDTQSAHIFAPYEGLLATDTDTPDTADTRYTEWRDAVEAMLPNAYEPVSVRFNERQETNRAISAG